jgi:type II secretory pathway pseudopilin PulG
MSLLEALFVVTIVIVVAGMSLPTAATALDDGRARQAAAFAAGELRGAKQEAVMKSAAVALVFSAQENVWTYRRCIDGNANGVRKVDIASGKDRCVQTVDLSAIFAGVVIGVDPTIPGPDGDPSSADPVRFGASDIASFSPGGSCTAGTLFVRSGKGTQYAIRIAGITGRLRVLRYNPGARRWTEV